MPWYLSFFRLMYQYIFIHLGIIDCHVRRNDRWLPDSNIKYAQRKLTVYLFHKCKLHDIVYYDTFINDKILWKIPGCTFSDKGMSPIAFEKNIYNDAFKRSEQWNYIIKRILDISKQLRSYIDHQGSPYTLTLVYCSLKLWNFNCVTLDII